MHPRPFTRAPRRAARRAGRVLAAALTLAVAGSAMALTATTAGAVPVEGHTGWSVVMCKYADQTQEPQAAPFFRDFLTDVGRGKGGVADYLADQSRGRIDLRNSTVAGWYTMSQTVAVAGTESRWQKIQDCLGAASRGGYTVPAGFRVVAIVNSCIDSGSAGGQVLLDPCAWNVRFAAHEMLHGYGLGHSYSDDLTYQNAPWSAPGEYDDPWDEMSAQHSYAFTTARFGASAVSLNGYFRDKLGWLDRSQVKTFGADGIGTRTMTLRPLEQPALGGTQLIRVPFDPGDLFHYYTVELRQKTGWSAGIPNDIVLIHEVRGGTPYLMRSKTGAHDPIQTLNANGVSIQVGTVSSTSATVTITSNIIDRCVQGYVWREARPSDHVCVTGAVRSQTWADNAAAPSRWVVGPYGPHTCISGYVWREAFAGDDVCVTGAQRTEAANLNATAWYRVNPARSVYGPNTCASGYVWREADGSDYVCVSGAVRTATRADNAAATSRWVNGAYGPHTCISGFVWREAFPADQVCVTGAQRAQTASENATAGSRVARP